MTLNVNNMQKVGKLNSSIDIIPLQGSSDDLKSKSMNNKHKNNSTHKYFRDQLLISRVQTYMHENESKIYLDVTEMADSLQKKYRDYRVKKRGPFRALVRKAYDDLTEMFSDKYTREWSAYDEEDDEEEVDVESDSQNTMMDNMLLKMYKKSQNKQNGNSSDKELIDISSDDDDASKIESSSTKTSEPKIMEKNSQQKPGPSSSIEKPVPTKEVEQLITTTPGKKAQEVKTVESTSTVTNKPVLKQNVKKRQREKSADVANQPAKKAKRIPVFDSKVTFADIGGNDKVLQTVYRLITHMKRPDIFKQLGTTPPTGILLHGPNGCGKTLLAHAIAGELQLPLLKVASTELVAGVSGESESRIRQLFEQALAIAPCVMFLDEIDVIAQHRSTAQREMEKRIVGQLLSCFDDLNSEENGTRVLVLGATNRPDSLDTALRTPGRFDREICLGMPDTKAREKILAIHTKKVKLAPNISLSRIASLTPGFVGGDLVALIKEAGMAVLDRLIEDLETVSNNKSPEKTEITNVVKNEEENFKNTGNLIEEAKIESSTSNQTDVSTLNKTQTTDNNNQENSESTVLTRFHTLLHDDTSLSSERVSNLCIEFSDFETALRVVQPCAKREGFATVPDVTWDDIGALRDIKEELQILILGPVRHPEVFKSAGLTVSSGVLLCGPPGCGKTVLAKAIANEADINFISVKGAELLDKYVGESEKAIRQCFLRAKNSAPCVIFFDELDALCPTRSGGDNTVTSRVVNQMLTEMDGVEGREGVFIMGATNRPDIIDEAVLRPGRFETILYVDLPTAADRVDILRALTKTKQKLAADVNLEEIGYDSKCDGFTGADVAALVREAGKKAVTEYLSMNNTGQLEISARHFLAAFNKIRPSVQEEGIKRYEKLKKLYSIKKKSDDTLMETPVDTPIVDVVMEPMEP